MRERESPSNLEMEEEVEPFTCCSNASTCIHGNFPLGKRACVCAPSCLTLCNSVDCSPPGSSVHGLIQARILVWVAVAFSRGSSQFRG